MSRSCFGFPRKKSKPSLRSLDSPIALPKSASSHSPPPSHQPQLALEESYFLAAASEDSDQADPPPAGPKPFLNQNIAKIRARHRPFHDNKFLPFIASIVESPQSQLYVSLASRLKCRSLAHLNELVEWRRARDIAQQLQLPAEFVLDNEGRAPTLPAASLDYAQFFSAYDISQGWIGTCFYLSAMVGRVRNAQLLATLIPGDNLGPESAETGAYHFRLWRLGHWHDVVVDEALPVSARTGGLVFSFNRLYANEFWVPLFEKALAKFLGSYDELEAGSFENSAMFLSGGLHEEYLIGQLDGSESGGLPDRQGLFEIIEIAVQNGHIVGCTLENVGRFR